MERKIKELASMLKSSENIVVMTGAGMDTESNIPDFRSKDGWWKKLDPRAVASVDTLYENYALFHEFYSYRIKLLEDIIPHDGHYVLSDLEEKGLIKSIVTQNVSGLHRGAGNKNVYELHGNIKSIRCNNCNKIANIDDFLEKKNCSYCDKKALRPEIVLFGEALPTADWESAFEDIENSDLLIIIGTSLEVSPVNQFPRITRGRTIYINREDNLNYDFNLKIIGSAKETLLQLKEIL